MTFLKSVVKLHGIILFIVEMRIKFNLGKPPHLLHGGACAQHRQSHSGQVVARMADLITLKPEQIKSAP